MSNDYLFIGATTRICRDADQYFKPTRECVPGNYTKEDTILKFEQDLLEKRRTGEIGYDLPLLAVLDSAVVINQLGETLFTLDNAPGRCGPALVRFLTQWVPDNFPQQIWGDPAAKATPIFGLDIKQILQIAAFETLVKPEGPTVPVRLWFNPLRTYDVLDVLLPGQLGKHVDIRGLNRYFNTDIDISILGTSAQERANAAFQLVNAAQLNVAALSATAI